MVVNNKLTPEYASQPVVILGYDTESKVAPNRKSRFWAAAPNANSLPYMMVDSGHQVYWGIDAPDLDAKYHSMIDAERGRPPQAAIDARYARVGDHFQFTVKVTNQSGVTLSASANKAMVHAVVYETFTNATRPAGVLVNNFVRVTAALSMTQALANGATGSYTLTTLDLPAGVNWANLHMVVMADYIPSGSTAYDMLQAAIAQPGSPSYAIAPARLDFLISAKAPADQTKQITVTSDSTTMTWSATSNAGWISVSPASAGVGTPVTVKVTAGALAAGTQSGKITFQISEAGGFNATEEIPVSAFLGDIRKVFLPYIRH